MIPIPVLMAAALATCPGNTTIEVNDCLSAELAADRAELDRYSAAARKRLVEENPTTVAKFDAMQTAFFAYRKKACDAVYDYWSGGTIRGTEALTCQRRLTRAYTHDLWTDWLTYPDDTPPILPEPSVGKRRRHK